MALSKDDQNRLDALAAFTQSDDPILAAGFDCLLYNSSGGGGSC
jgi:hypothetical protein